MSTIAQGQVIFWTLALVAGLGVSGLLFMLEPPATPKTVAKAAAKARVPASAKGETVVAFTDVGLSDPNSRQAVELSLGCETKSEARSDFDFKVTQVRISGKACGPERTIASTEVVNQANGFSATVFHPSDKTYTTDYISLNTGANKIRIVHRLKNGASEERDYHVERKPDTSVE